jgi:hypothetical protein
MEDENEDDSVTTSGDIEDCPFAKVTDNHPPPFDDDSTPPPLLVRRSTHQRFPTSRFTYRTHAAITRNFSDLCLDAQQGHKVEVETSSELTHIDPLLPTPDNWRQILSYPPHIKILWIKSFVKELKELIKKGTVVHENPNKDDPHLRRVSGEAKNTNRATRRHDKRDDVHP